MVVFRKIYVDQILKVYIVEFKGKLFAETLEGCIYVQAKEAKLEVLSPVGEVIAQLEGIEENGEIQFAVNGTIPGIQYHLTVKR